MKPKISFLLGSGFSKPAEFPLVGEINQALSSVKANNLLINPDGTSYLFPKNEIEGNPIMDEKRLFFEEFLNFYTSQIVKGEANFHYEDFFDFYRKHRREPSLTIEQFCNDFNTRHQIECPPNSVTWILWFHTIFSQLLKNCLTKNCFFENAFTHKNTPPYDAFVGFLFWLKDSFEVKLHSLNHDMLLDFLGFQTDLGNYFSDGFSKHGSPYYGRLENYHKDENPIVNYDVRLRCFQDKFDKEICLFKLHGCIDTYAFDLSDQNYDSTRIKRGYGIKEFMREYFDDGSQRFRYAYSIPENYPDFLSGTTEKMKPYEEDHYYRSLINHFKKNLSDSELLIVTGYGFGDKGINDILVDNFLKLGKRMVVIDPGVWRRELIEEYGATELKRGITDLSLDELRSLIQETQVVA